MKAFPISVRESLRQKCQLSTAFDHEEPMTAEEILLRFKKVMGRDMTPEEKHKFFLPEPPDVVDETPQNPPKILATHY